MTTVTVVMEMTEKTIMENFNATVDNFPNDPWPNFHKGFEYCYETRVESMPLYLITVMIPVSRRHMTKHSHKISVTHIRILALISYLIFILQSSDSDRFYKTITTFLKPGVVKT